VIRYRVQDLSGGNRESSVTDGGQSNWRHNRPIGFGRTQRQSTMDITFSSWQFVLNDLSYVFWRSH